MRAGAGRVVSWFWAHKSGDTPAWRLRRCKRQRQDLDEVCEEAEMVSTVRGVSRGSRFVVHTLKLSSVMEDIPDGMRRVALVQLCIPNRSRGLHIEANDQSSPEYLPSTASTPKTAVKVLIISCSFFRDQEPCAGVSNAFAEAVSYAVYQNKKGSLFFFVARVAAM